MLGVMGPRGISPHQLAYWPISPQEDVLNTQCGYDVRLKLVRGLGTELGALGWKGQPPINSSVRSQEFCGGGGTES